MCICMCTYTVTIARFIKFHKYFTSPWDSSWEVKIEYNVKYDLFFRASTSEVVANDT